MFDTATVAPPHNLDAEASLLGAMLLSRDAIGAALELVSADDFYRPANAHVFDAVTTLYAAGEPADPVTVAEALRRAGLLDAIGGPACLVALQAGTPAIASAARYARIVSDHAVLRRLVAAGAEIAELGASLPDDVAEALDRAEGLVFGVAERKVATNLVSLTQSLDESLEALERRHDRGERLVGVPSGFRDLDDLLLGLVPSNLVVVGARPSVGKTAFALAIARHVAIHQRRPVLFVSMEMSHLELTQRVVAAEAKVDGRKLRRGDVTDPEWCRISHALGRLTGAPLFIDDDANASVMGIRARARRLKARQGDLALVVVDYLQLMAGTGRAESRQVEVAQLSRGLKLLARELGVPVLALSQLSRGLEARADKRPVLADLRESGAVEQDADVVLFLYRDDVYVPDSADRGTAEVLVAKHRNGPTGMIRLAFVGEHSRFDDLARFD